MKRWISYGINAGIILVFLGPYLYMLASFFLNPLQLRVTNLNGTGECSYLVTDNRLVLCSTSCDNAHQNGTQDFVYLNSGLQYGNPLLYNRLVAMGFTPSGKAGSEIWLQYNGCSRVTTTVDNVVATTIGIVAAGITLIAVFIAGIYLLISCPSCTWGLGVFYCWTGLCMIAPLGLFIWILVGNPPNSAAVVDSAYVARVIFLFVFFLYGCFIVQYVLVTSVTMKWRRVTTYSDGSKKHGSKKHDGYVECNIWDIECSKESNDIPMNSTS